MRYNIVLVPNSKQQKIFEELSQNYFSEVHAGYLLGGNSIPHITLCQFECEELELQYFLNRFHSKYSKLNCVPEFSGLSLIKLGGQFSGLQAAELSVVRNPDIMQLHRSAVEFIHEQGIQHLNAVGEVYRPHLTLACFDPVKASNTNIPLRLPSNIFENINFEVGIGIADTNWQLNKIIKESDKHFFLKSRFSYSSKDIDLFDRIQETLGVVLNEFLEGRIFSKQPYTQKEIELILSDLSKIVLQQFSPQTYSKSPRYLTTAGAPGVGKSFYIENNYGSNPSHAVYIDPDRVGLPGLSGYHHDRRRYGDSYAYEKWRDASNFIANFMLVKACAESRNIIHGTTATNFRVIEIYKSLKVLGYKVKVELLFANVAQRALATNYRAKDKVQVTAEDFREKAKPIFFRINDAYLKHCDSVNFYFQSGSFWLGHGQLVKFATFKKTDKRLNITSAGMMEEFYNEMRAELTAEEIQQFESSLKKSEVYFSYEPRLILKQQLFQKFYFDFFKNKNNVTKESSDSLALIPYEKNKFNLT